MKINRRVAFAQISLGALTAALFGVKRAAATETVTYSYDALGRLVGVAYADGSTVTYTYDAAGNRSQVVRSSPSASVTLSASPTTITLGGSSTLSWTSAHVTSTSIDHSVGSVTPA